MVPCYNAEHYVKRALDSVFAQTYRQFHIYAVDDGSTDNTVQVLQRNGDRCCVVSQRHSGAAAARNRAIRMSDSVFVAFLDADDEWLPAKLERQVTLMKRDPSLGLVCTSCAVRGDQHHSEAVFALPDLPVSGRLFRDLVRNCFIVTPTVVVRRRCLEEAGLFNESLSVCEDFNLWLKIAARWRIAFLPEVLATTYKHRESLSANISAEDRLRTGVASLEDVLCKCPQLSRSEANALRTALAERNYFYGSFLLSSGANRRARHSLASALKLQPFHWRAMVKLGLSLLPADASKPLVGWQRTFADR